MSRRGWAVAAMFLAAAGPAGSAQTVPPAIGPVDAVRLAGEFAPDGAKGRFAFVVRSTAKTPHGVFLNSAEDYRDPLNLSVELTRSTTAGFKRQFGARPDTYFKGKSIVVDGTARRVKVVFAGRGLPTDKYYFQTRITVDDPTTLGVDLPIP